MRALCGPCLVSAVSLSALRGVCSALCLASSACGADEFHERAAERTAVHSRGRERRDRETESAHPTCRAEHAATSRQWTHERQGGRTRVRYKTRESDTTQLLLRCSTRSFLHFYFVGGNGAHNPGGLHERAAPFCTHAGFGVMIDRGHESHVSLIQRRSRAIRRVLLGRIGLAAAPPY